MIPYFKKLKEATYGYSKFQTLQTLLGHSATRYHNLNALPYALPYIFFEICMDLGYLQQTATRYSQSKKGNSIYIFYKFDGNAW